MDISPDRSGTPENQEMSLAEMMFLVSAAMYTSASNIASKALQEKNENFIVVKQANNPAVRNEIEIAAKENADLKDRVDDTTEATMPEVDSVGEDAEIIPANTPVPEEADNPEAAPTEDISF